MFKFVVLCAFVAASVAEPEPQFLYPGLVQPYASYSTVVSPASTSISSSSSSVIHPSPAVSYASLPYAHYIKKRSAQFLTPAFNAAYNYYPTSYLSTGPVVSAPLTYSSPAVPLAAPFATHLIKKRSADPQYVAPFYPSSYSYVSNPAFTTPVVSTPYVATPYYSNAGLPLVNAHLIKKRSADPQFIAPFYPSSYSYVSNPAITTPVVSTPYVASPYYNAGLPVVNAHLIKKRSADPQFLSLPAATTYYSGSPLYPTYTPTTTVIKSAPIISANPFVYSTFIKK